MATDENGILPPQLAKLVVRVDGTADTAEDIIKTTMREIRGELAVLAKELNLATSGKDREKAYAMISAKMARLEKRLTALQQADLDYAGLAANRQAADDTGVKVQYSQKRADEISAIVSPMQGENLAAVFTQRMEKSIIQELRTATVATMREAAVAGMPMRDMARVLDERWQKAAKDGVALQFRDAAGKVWDTKTYMMMNTRTNAMRVYNDNLIDNIARATGSDLVMVSTGGDPHCKHCFPWEGRILSVSGKTKGFPTYDEARAAGLFHPNCTHTLEPVDELIDADEIELQRGVPSPDQVEDPLKQAFQLDVSTRKREDGISDEQAALAVKRQWLKDAVRNGLPFEGSEDMIDGLTDAEVNALVEGDSGRVPAFEPTKGTKKNPDPQQFHAGSAGGVVHINRNNLTADALRELDGLKDRLAEARKQAEEDGRKKTFTPNMIGIEVLGTTAEAYSDGIEDIKQKAAGIKDAFQELFNDVNREFGGIPDEMSKDLFAFADIVGNGYKNISKPVENEYSTDSIRARRNVPPKSEDEQRALDAFVSSARAYWESRIKECNLAVTEMKDALEGARKQFEELKRKAKNRNGLTAEELRIYNDGINYLKHIEDRLNAQVSSNDSLLQEAERKISSAGQNPERAAAYRNLDTLNRKAVAIKEKLAEFRRKFDTVKEEGGGGRRMEDAFSVMRTFVLFNDDGVSFFERNSAAKRKKLEDYLKNLAVVAASTPDAQKARQDKHFPNENADERRARMESVAKIQELWADKRTGKAKEALPAASRTALDIAPKPVVDGLAKLNGKVSMVLRRGNASKYEPFYRRVIIGTGEWGCTRGTIAHELTHAYIHEVWGGRRDAYKQGGSIVQSFRDIIDAAKEDFADFSAAKLNGEGTRGRLGARSTYNGYQNMYEAIHGQQPTNWYGKPAEERDIYASIADIFCAATNGDAFYGHSRSYFTTADHRVHEICADTIALVAERREDILQHLPKTRAAVMRVLFGVQ